MFAKVLSFSLPGGITSYFQFASPNSLPLLVNSFCRYSRPAGYNCPFKTTFHLVQRVDWHPPSRWLVLHHICLLVIFRWFSFKIPFQFSRWYHVLLWTSATQKGSQYEVGVREIPLTFSLPPTHPPTAGSVLFCFLTSLCITEKWHILIKESVVCLGRRRQTSKNNKMISIDHHYWLINALKM